MGLSFLQCLLLSTLFCFFLNIPLFVASNTLSQGQSLSGNQTIVSQGAIFELGFFKPGKSQNSYLGIWYNNRPEKTVVWMANRDKPVTNPLLTELEVSVDGNLVLLSQSKIQLWSTNITSTASKSTIALLLDTGNFILRDLVNSSMVYWQSFDHPTDTWLPGQRLGWNKNTKEYITLTSWRSPDDPSPGLYSFGVDTRGTNQLVQTWNGSDVYWSSGEWNGQSFSYVPEMTRKSPFSYKFVENERYITYTISVTSIITRLIVDVSGRVLQWALLNNNPEWVLIWTQPRSPCDVQSMCGVFANCDDNGLPICGCLQGFQPAHQPLGDLSYLDKGCLRRTPLQCGGQGEMDKFVMIPSARLPGNSKAMTAESAEDCQSICLANCSCIAYTYIGAQCSVWNEYLFDVRQPSYGSGMAISIYLRLAASEIITKRHSKNFTVGLIVGIVGGFIIFIVTALILIRRFYRRRDNRVSDGMNAESGLLFFRYRELKTITNNFSERLGGGGFGSVFKGTMPDMTLVAVKMLEGSGQGEKQFRAEVCTMGIIQHVNLVRLHGFCCEEDKRLLVYDLMRNGSLDSHLFEKRDEVLNWRMRYEIALGVARGLVYLHEKCRDCIIHCDIKPENILLDENFCPKLADFGLAKLMGRDFSRVLTSMRGTLGYLAPEWITGLPITPKADVYSYGMVLFELISGRRNISQDGDWESTYFPLWAAEKITAEEQVLCLLDETLDGCADLEELTRACRVACWCIQDEAQRPSMNQVVQMLEGTLELHMPPVPRNLQQLLEDSNDYSISL